MRTTLDLPDHLVEEARRLDIDLAKSRRRPSQHNR
jgi:hypothetical protein